MITIKSFEITCTPAELEQIPEDFLAKLGLRSAVTEQAEAINGTDALAEEAPVEARVTLEKVQKLLTVKPLRKFQKALLAVTYRANDFISAHDICAQMSEMMGETVDRRMLMGTMGGCGLRTNAVRGWPRRPTIRPTRLLWEHGRREDGDYYKMTPLLRQAIDNLNIL